MAKLVVISFANGGVPRLLLYLHHLCECSAENTQEHNLYHHVVSQTYNNV